MIYKFTTEDFKKVFTFSVNYYLDPTKNTTGRTTGEPRGLGAIIDDFTLGKLTEIGVEKVLFKENPKKEYILDFDIKSNHKAKDEADIVKIKESGKIREPAVFIEIKNTFDNGRWIGLTEEQYKTMKKNAGTRKIYMIYASIQSKTINKNPRTADLSGMFLKTITKKLDNQFKDFADIDTTLNIEFIISNKDLDTYSYPFKKGMNMYETNLFELKNRSTVYKNNGERVKNVNLTTEYAYELFTAIELDIKTSEKAENTDISTFDIKGDFKIFSKNEKSIIECISRVHIKNKIFGEFKLEKNNFYSFNLVKIGRNPKLQRNNIFIAKKTIEQLIKSQKIKTPKEIIKDIAKVI